MKPRNFLLTYLFTLIGGILLVIFNKSSNLLETVVIIIGILFIIASLLSVGTALFSRPTQPEVKDKLLTKISVIIPALAALIFGILLVSMPGFFSSWVIYTFAVMMILLGLIQLLFMGFSIRTLGTSGWYLVVPLIIIATGVICIVMGSEKVANAINMLTGIALIVYSLNGFIGYAHREGKLRQHQLLIPSSYDPEELKSDSEKTTD